MWSPPVRPVGGLVLRLDDSLVRSGCLRGQTRRGSLPGSGPDGRKPAGRGTKLNVGTAPEHAVDDVRGAGVGAGLPLRTGPRGVGLPFGAGARSAAGASSSARCSWSTTSPGGKR